MAPTARTGKPHPNHVGPWLRKRRFLEQIYPRTCRHCASVQGDPRRSRCNPITVDQEDTKSPPSYICRQSRGRCPACRSRFDWEQSRHHMCQRCAAIIGGQSAFTIPRSGGSGDTMPSKLTPYPALPGLPINQIAGHNPATPFRPGDVIPTSEHPPVKQNRFQLVIIPPW